MARIQQVRQFVGVPVYLTPNEAADVLHVTPRTVYEWLRTGQLEGFRPAGRWLISTDQIQKFVSRRKPQSREEARKIVYDRAEAVQQVAPAKPAPAKSLPISNSVAVTKTTAVLADLVAAPPLPSPLANRKRKGR